jgi:hypothetical protein
MPIPHTRDAAPFLYYLFYRSRAVRRLPIHDYVVTPIDAAMPAAEQLRRLRAANTSVIKLNHVVHHGAIGHHVQNYYAMRGRRRSAAWRGRLRERIGCSSAARWPRWAGCATDLMDEGDSSRPTNRSPSTTRAHVCSPAPSSTSPARSARSSTMRSRCIATVPDAP